MPHKVCVCGGSGGIGQPLACMMTLNPRVSEVSVVDVSMAMVPAPGVAADLDHIDSNAKVKGYGIDPKVPAVEQLEEALTGCDLVLIPAGVPRKPGMTRDDLFGINAGIAKGLVDACAKHCPNAVLGMIVNPVNSISPAMSKMYENQGLDPMKVIGVTTLDIVRACKFVGTLKGLDPTKIDIPVVGGHAGTTILPLFSQATCNGEKIEMTDDEIEALDKRTQDAGTEVVNAKGGSGSATLSMAYAAAKFADVVLGGLDGTEGVACAYVKSSVRDGLNYFSSKVKFGPKGVTEVMPIGDVSDYEAKRLDELCPQLADEVSKGLEFLNK